MTYYEELGLPPDASAREIRQSYKRLAVLFHPDQQRDPATRSLAETQMKRVNEMVAILTDPQRRRLYDQHILEERTASPQPALKRRYLGWTGTNKSWAVAGCGVVILLIFALFVPGSGSQVRTKLRAPLSPEEPVRPVTPIPRTPPKPATFDVGGANKQELRPPSDSLNHVASPPASQIATAFPAVPVKAPHVDLSATIPSDPGHNSSAALEHPLAGHWIYAPEAGESASPGFFPADYVELRINVVGGTMRGSYRSRYKTHDRTTNPIVNFTFEGPPDAGSFIWRSASGASGEIICEIDTTGALRVRWFATVMDPALSLGSGMATLYRFR